MLLPFFVYFCQTAKNVVIKLQCMILYTWIELKDEFWTDIQNTPMKVMEPMWCHPTSLPFSFSIFCAFYVDTADQPISHCGDFVTPVKSKRDEKQLWTISRRKSSEAQEGRRSCGEWQSSTPRPRHINETVTLLKLVSNEPNEKSTAKFTKRTSF